jgi:hypothetical protein
MTQKNLSLTIQRYWNQWSCFENACAVMQNADGAAENDCVSENDDGVVTGNGGQAV